MTTPSTADLQAVVFDFDGLVLDTEWCEYVTAAEVFTEHGTELSLDLWRTFIGTVDHPHWTEILADQLGHPVDRDALIARRQVLKERCGAGLVPLPGVVDLMGSLAADGLALAVASSSSASWVEGHLDAHGLRDRFLALATGDEVPRSKPDPAVYRLAVERIGVDPAAVVAIEDSVNGVTAARSAGLAVVAVPCSLTRGMDFSHADLVVGSCRDLSPARLRGLLSGAG